MTNGLLEFPEGGGERQEDYASLWRDHHGLAGDPFQDHPDFFFTGAQRQHYLDTLSHLAVFGDMVLLVAGDSGTGKTRLLAEFVRQTRPRLEIHRIKSVALADAARLPELLARLSGQPFVGLEPEDACDRFFRWSEEKAHKDRRWALVMDNADAASDRVLNALVNGFLSADTTSAAVPILAGSHALPERLPLPLSDESAYYRVNLAPLDRDDLQHFIQASFDHVGGDARDFLDPHRLAVIAERSEGNMRRIREVAPGVLLGRQAVDAVNENHLAPASGTSRSFSGMLRNGLGPRQRVWAGTVLGLLGLSVVVAGLLHEREPESDVQEEITTDFDEVERARELIADTETQITADEEGVEAVTEGLVERETDEPEPAGDEPAEEELPEIVEVSLPETEAPAQEDPPSEEVAEAEPEATPEDEIVEDGFSPAKPEYYRDPTWYQAKPQGSYTVQLLGSFNESTAIDFIESHGGQGMVYVRTTHQERPWFIVILGEYSDRSAARGAIDGLSEELRALGPWARPFQDL